jgi:hypothetical protein
MLKQECRGCGQLKNLPRHFWHKPACRAANECEPQCEDVMDIQELDSPPVAEPIQIYDVRRPLQPVMAPTNMVYQSDTAMRSLSDLNRWTTEGHIGDKWKTDIKDSIKRNIDLTLDGVEESLRSGHTNHTVDEIIPILRSRLDLFHGLRNPSQEEAAVKSKMPYLQTFPRKVGPRVDDIAYMTVVADWIQLMMNSDKRWGAARRARRERHTHRRALASLVQVSRDDV